MDESDIVRQGTKCYLRRVRPHDSEPFYSWYCNGEVQRHLANPWWNPGIDYETYRQYRFSLYLERSPISGVLVICATNDRPVGLVNYFDLDEINRSCEVGIIIGEIQDWRQGYALGALRLLVDYLNVDLGIENVRARILEANVASQQLFAKAGFEFNGTAREQDFLFHLYIYHGFTRKA
jgi:diamine N-acetyltransferase